MPNHFHFTEQHNYPDKQEISPDFPQNVPPILFGKNPKKRCVEFTNAEGGTIVNTSYFIGLDWIGETEKTIFVVPKLDSKQEKRTNYLQMLMLAFELPEAAEVCQTLYEIKFDQPEIQVTEEEDLLTPLIVLQYVNLVKQIVRKGLRKSYYVVQKNLNSRVKGKVLIGQNLKQNVLKNRQLFTLCQYEEFGFNSLENKLLKKALAFSKRFLPTIPGIGKLGKMEEMYAYIDPAFIDVSAEIELNELRHSKRNAFFKEYESALQLAKIILKRFGYQIHKTDKSHTFFVPPYWIDMSKLFELYVLRLLRDHYMGQGRVHFQFAAQYQELDFLINTENCKMVVDAKYKLRYKDTYDVADMRQVSGYARLERIYKELGVPFTQVLDCLIVYPMTGNDPSAFGLQEFSAIPRFVKFQKVGVKLPLVK